MGGGPHLSDRGPLPLNKKDLLIRQSDTQARGEHRQFSPLLCAKSHLTNIWGSVLLLPFPSGFPPAFSGFRPLFFPLRAQLPLPLTSGSETQVIGSTQFSPRWKSKGAPGSASLTCRMNKPASPPRNNTQEEKASLAPQVLTFTMNQNHPGSFSRTKMPGWPRVRSRHHLLSPGNFEGQPGLRTTALILIIIHGVTA